MKQKWLRGRRVGEPWWRRRRRGRGGVTAIENGTGGSSDTCVTECYSINIHDDLHQSENPLETETPPSHSLSRSLSLFLSLSRSDSPSLALSLADSLSLSLLYLLGNIDYSKPHRRGSFNLTEL